MVDESLRVRRVPRTPKLGAERRGKQMQMKTMGRQALTMGLELELELGLPLVLVLPIRGRRGTDIFLLHGMLRSGQQASWELGGNIGRYRRRRGQGEVEVEVDVGTKVPPTDVSV